jgi:hypothetical protein
MRWVAQTDLGTVSDMTIESGCVFVNKMTEAIKSSTGLSGGGARMGEQYVLRSVTAMTWSIRGWIVLGFHSQSNLSRLQTENTTGGGT